MPESHPLNPKLPPCPACQSVRTVQTSEHFGELLFFCLNCEHSWTVHPGKLPPHMRMEAVSASAGDCTPALRAHDLRLARRAVTLTGRAAAAQAASTRPVVAFEARREVSPYLRLLINRARAIRAWVH